MMFVVEGYKSVELDFVNAEFHFAPCIGELRKEVLRNLPITKYDSFLMACKDSVTGAWTEWKPMIYNFPLAIDLHRSILACEIVVESDFLEYEKNVLLMQEVGKVLEAKGWVLHYFYSGSKSIHAHLFLSFDKAFSGCDQQLLKTATSYYVNEKRFVKEFMEFVREQVLKGGMLNLDFFDKQLIRCSHLIRMQLSKNKKGFKTFIGKTWKDLSMIAPVRDWTNNRFPDACTKFELSVPNDFDALLSKFVRKIGSEKKKKKLESVQLGLMGFSSASVKPCVQKILGDVFVDGRKRLMFVLVNELKKSKKLGEVEGLVKRWCEVNDLKFVQAQFDVVFFNDSLYISKNKSPDSTIQIGTQILKIENHCPTELYKKFKKIEKFP
jgi:hypothetical protein